MKTSVFFLASLFTLALGKPTTRSLKLHEALDAPPSSFFRAGPADPDQTLRLHLALPRGNAVELERKLYDVSTPSSPNYGKYLSKSEVHQLVAPVQRSVDAVNAWLEENGISANRDSATGDWLLFEVPVSKANELFAADFSVFRHEETSAEAAIYNIPEDAATNQTSNRLAVASFLSQYANRADLQTFLSQYRPDIPSNTTFTLETLKGRSNPQNPRLAGEEANLDIQYTVGVATGVQTVFISMGYSTIDAWFDLADFLLDQDSPPTVLTTSYGVREDKVSPKLAQHLCDSYLQLGLRSVSVLFASGDGGVSGTRFTNDCEKFVPTFPSSCPYVTSVGASRSVPETAAELSVGGFLNVFSMPAYQVPAVHDYLTALRSTHKGLYNATGRAFPDVAAQGVVFKVVVGGKERLINGTSASSPVFASVVALLNDQLLAKGRPPLGFLNPLLYPAVGQPALNDITSGSNPGCKTSGFPAREGWDPVTGLGTPDFERLARVVGV